MSSDDKIIPLRERETDSELIDVPSDEELEAIMARNKAKADKRAKERAVANKSVLRSYRIKS